MGDAGPAGVQAGQPVPRGDRVLTVPRGARTGVFRELFALWLGALLLMRGVVTLQTGAGLPDWVLAAVPLLFIYAPVWLCRWRGVDSWSYRLSIPAFSDWAAWKSALALNAKVVAVILVPWLVGYHLYQTRIFHFRPGHALPGEWDWLPTLVAYQVFFVAIPEEFFYRGYFQTRLNEVFERRWMIFGVPMGWGAVIAGLFFAFGHSVVEFQWWHFATFFPGMAFAWMREKTGGVISGALFHAFCNVCVVLLDTFYGIRPLA